jgi:hypothetical protein
MRPEALASWLKSWRARYRVLAAELPEDDREPR